MTNSAKLSLRRKQIVFDQIRFNNHICRKSAKLHILQKELEYIYMLKQPITLYLLQWNLCNPTSCDIRQNFMVPK